MRHSLCVVIFLAANLLYAAAPAAASNQTRIWVNYDLYGDRPSLFVLNANNTVLAEYPIVTPAPHRTPKCLTHGDITGTVHRMDRNASWTPTPNIIRAMREKGVHLKRSYGPNDPGNALAGKKLWIDWDDPCIASTVRIHATYKEDRVRARARESFGCIRMLPTDWLDMAARIEPGTVVVLSATSPPSTLMLSEHKKE